MGSIKGRILSIVIVAAIGFATYIALNFMQARHQASQLEKIQNQHFPIQVQLQQAVFALKQTHAYLEEAVFTAEQSSLDRAQSVATQFLSTLDAAGRIEPSAAASFQEMAVSFNSYYSNSVFLANKLIEGTDSGDDLAQLGKSNLAAFEHLVARLEKQLGNETLAFTQGIDSVSERARKNVTTGALTGLMTTLLIVLVAWFLLQRVVGRIEHMVTSLKNIAEQKSDLSTRIPVENGDEMSVLAHWFNTFIEKLERVTNESSRKMQHLANTDALTNLPNRRLFNQLLNRVIEETQQGANHRPAVFFIDLDNFKYVNDHLGHDIGDAVLRVISERLIRVTRHKSELRLDDNTPQRVIARMGGDEFMLLTTGVNEKEALSSIAERIRTVVLDPIAVNEHEIHVGVSIGIAQYPEDGKEAAELIVHADMAMYEAKRGGKNNYRFFDDSMAEAVTQPVTMENQLREALQNNALELYAQPIVDMKQQRVVSAELLLRWPDHTAENAAPLAHIRNAENSDLIFELDEWVLHKACATLQHLLVEGLPPTPLSINISAQQASHPTLISKVVDALNHYDVPPYLLSLEITETATLANMEAVTENIKKLKNLSVKVSIDDFGSGHSSLSLLKDGDIDTLKLDKGLTQTIKTNPSVNLIMQTVITLANKLKINIVAEGIENDEQATLLKKMNCQCGQGYHFGKPMPIADFKALLKRESDNCHVKSINL